MQRIILSLFLCISGILSVYAQSEVCGKITDKQTGELLSGVYITAYYQNSILFYTISKEDGTFCANLANKKATHLQFYSMGYKQQKIELSAAIISPKILDVCMEPHAIELNTLVVKPPPVSIKGDTTVYDASIFKRNEDRNIGEVIARLPGVQVNAGGQIRVSGEVINKFYIEDMDLLGGRYGMAVRNLRPEDISYIQVYNNHQPIKALSGVEITNRAAINIKLTQKAKRRWLLSFGAEAGSGYRDLLYSAKTGIMRFAGKTQTFILAKSDNAGNNIVRETALQNRGPGHFSLDRLDNDIRDLFHISIRILPIPEAYYYINKSHVASINQLNRLSTKSEVKANLLFTSNDLADSYAQKQVITTPDNEIITLSDSSRAGRKDTRLSGEITFTSNREQLYLQDILAFKIIKDEALSDVSSGNNLYHQTYNLPKFQIENKLSFIKGSSGKTYKFYNNTRFSHLNQKFQVESTLLNPLFGSKLITQSLFQKEFNNNAYFSFIKRIFKTTLSLEPGAELLYNTFDSQLHPAIISEENKINTQNNLSLLSVRPYLNLAFAYYGQKIKLNISFPAVLRVDHLNSQWNNYFIYSPTLRADYAISPSLSINSQIGISNQIGEIESMTQGYIYTSYRNLSANEVISKRINQRYKLVLDYKSPERFFSANLTATYTTDWYNTSLSDLYLNNYILTTWIEGSKQNNNFNLYGSIRKSFGINIFTIGGDIQYGYTKTSQYLQNQLYNYNIRNYGITFSMRYTPNEFIAADYLLNITRNSFTSVEKSHIDYFSNKLSVVCFPTHSLEIKGTFNHILQKRKKYDDVSLPFLDVSASYKIWKKLSLHCAVKNILNVRQYKSMYYAGITSYSSTTQLRGVEFITGVSLDF